MDIKSPKISVVMPIYNAGEYLVRAIEDLLCQSFADFELICVDDGSTDSSAKIVKKYQAKDSRISLISQSNLGPSVARNKGLESASGEYVIFLDADDFYHKDLLSKLYEVAEKELLDIAVCRFDIYNDSKDSYSVPSDEPHGSIYDKGCVTSKNSHPDVILSSTTGYVWNKLFRASFIKEKELSFDPELYVFEDVYFVCSAMSLAESVGRVEDILLHHRVYSDQSRARHFRKYYGQVPVVYSKIKQFLMQRGMYIPLKRSFLNLSASRCFKIYNLLWSEGKARLWNLLHDEYAAEFDWINHEKDAFEDLEVYEFVANVALYTYEEILHREDQGKNLDIEQCDKESINKKVTQKQKISRRRAAWNKIMSFINIFKKRIHKED